MILHFINMFWTNDPRNMLNLFLPKAIWPSLTQKKLTRTWKTKGKKKNQNVVLLLNVLWCLWAFMGCVALPLCSFQSTTHFWNNVMHLPTPLESHIIPLCQTTHVQASLWCKQCLVMQTMLVIEKCSSFSSRFAKTHELLELFNVCFQNAQYGSRCTPQHGILL